MAANIMKFLVLPPMGFLCLVAVGWLISKKWRRAGLSLVGFGLTLLYLLSTPLVAGALLRSHQIYPAVAAGGHDPNVGAIVVLSGGLTRAAPEYGGDTVDSITLRRLRYAAKLHRETAFPLLVTGGVLKYATVSIAEIMRQTLEDDFKVPTAWVEPKARNTYENAKYASAILRAAGIGRIYLVTHAWHMPRAKSAFETMGLQVVPAPTAFLPDGPFHLGLLLPTASGVVTGYYGSYEWLARAWYALAYRKR